MSEECGGPSAPAAVVSPPVVAAAVPVSAPALFPPPQPVPQNSGSSGGYAGDSETIRAFLRQVGGVPESIRNGGYKLMLGYVSRCFG